MSCEPTLLPEPNHVMLNHLYALSIKVPGLIKLISSSLTEQQNMVVRQNDFLLSPKFGNQAVAVYLN
jgi:hypothetical protein